MPRGFYKHKLLLDENFPNRSRFPLLNKHFDIKNVRDDFKRGGAEDIDVYDLAVVSGRIIITFNTKHFRPLAGKKQDAGIIGVSSNLLAPQIDKKLTAFLKKTSPKSIAGKYIPFMSDK